MNEKDKYGLSVQMKVLKLLKSQDFSSSVLSPGSIIIYKKMMLAMFSENQLNQNYSKLNRLLKYTLESLKQDNKQINISYLLKKISIVHGYIFNLAKRQISITPIEAIIEEILQKTIIQQIKGINGQKRRSNSISKVYNYIRQLSRPKQNSKKINQSKLKLQNQSDKGAVKQIINKILTPYVRYLQKLLKNYYAFSQIINGKIDGDKNGRIGEQRRDYVWKIANWSHSLGDIVLQTNRIGKYFPQDFLGFQVTLVYIISVDLSMFYDMIQTEIDTEGQILNKSIQKQDFIENKYKESILNQNKDKIKKIENEQIKLLINESSLIKQTLNHIFYCQQLSMWKKCFAKSQYYSYQQSHRDAYNNNDKFLQILNSHQKNRKKHGLLGAQQSLGFEHEKGSKKEINLNIFKDRIKQSYIVNEDKFQEQSSCCLNDKIAKKTPLVKLRYMHLNRFNNKEEASVERKVRRLRK